MKLKKRNCPIRIELSPSGIQYLSIEWEICGNRHTFLASSHVGGQFSLFIQALYGLYIEEEDRHDHFDRRGTTTSITLPEDDNSLKDGELALQTEFEWDNEGEIIGISFRRLAQKGEDPFVEKQDYTQITITDTEEEKQWSYSVKSRDLCYAAAKAYTEAIKQYGFYGYISSTGSRCFESGDCVDLHMILFLKAVALGAKQSRVLYPVNKTHELWIGPCYTDFSKELELLLFDM